MTPEEYKSRLEVLKKQEFELTLEFIENNPFKELEGKLVNLTIGCLHKKVLFVGTDFKKDHYGNPDDLCLFYHKLNKNGTPRKITDHIPVRFYDGKLYKIEKI